MASILIVDDSPDQREYCEMIAQTYDHSVRQAINVDAALVLLDQGLKPDIILLDLMMPGRKPEELIQRVRGEETLSSTRIVIMSSVREIKSRTRQMGADLCIRKPFHFPQLVEALTWPQSHGRLKTR